MASRGYTQDQDNCELVYDWPTAKDFLDEDIYNELCQDEADYYINSNLEVGE